VNIDSKEALINLAPCIDIFISVGISPDLHGSYLGQGIILATMLSNLIDPTVLAWAKDCCPFKIGWFL